MPPTVIDELVVTLGLDPKDFDEAQRKALEKLRTFGGQSEAASKRIADAMSSGMAGFYQKFMAGLGSSDAAMARTGDQSRRTGEKIYAAGADSAVGFKKLTGSLLEAAAIIGTLEAAFHKLESSAGRATNTMVASLTTGLSPRKVGAIAGAFPLAGYGQMLAFEQSMASWPALIRQGKFPTSVANAFATHAALAHVPFSVNMLEGSQYERLREISRIVQGLPTAGLRGTFLREIGAPQNSVREFMKGPAALTRDIAASRQRMPLSSVTKTLTDLEAETLKTEQSWDTLWETLTADMAKRFGADNALTELDRGLQTLTKDINTLSGDKKLMGVEAASFDFMGRSVEALAKSFQDLFKVITNPSLKALEQFFKSLAQMPGFLFGRYIQDMLGVFGVKPPAWLKDWAGWSSSSTGTAHPPSAGPQARPPAGAKISGSLAADLAMVRQHESGGNYRAQNRTSTASGGYGFINSTWSRLATEAGYGQYAEMPAKMAPKKVQDAVAAYAYTHYDPNSAFLWAASAPPGGYPLYHPPVAVSSGGIGIIPSAQAATPSTTPSPPISGNWDWLTGALPQFQGGGVVPIAAHPGEMVLPLDISNLLRGLASSGSGRVGAISNSNHFDFSGLAIHTRATDANAIASQIRQSLTREMGNKSVVRTMAANTIFE